MDIKQIKELIKLIEKSSLTELTVKEDGCEITLKREKEILFSSNTEGVPASVFSNVNKPDDNLLTESGDGTELFLSPMVGTLYLSASEGADNYVKAGDIVKKGQPLCIIEAMKIMNEIDSEYDMQIVEIMSGNEAKVEYDQPLFKIKKI